jgi:hypothetical protein
VAAKELLGGIAEYLIQVVISYELFATGSLLMPHLALGKR